MFLYHEYTQSTLTKLSSFDRKLITFWWQYSWRHFFVRHCWHLSNGRGNAHELTVFWFLVFQGSAQKMKFSIQEFSRKCDQICSFGRIWSHLLKKFFIKNFIFRSVKACLIETCFIKPFEAPQRSVKIKIYLNFLFRYNFQKRMGWKGLTQIGPMLHFI